MYVKGKGTLYCYKLTFLYVNKNFRKWKSHMQHLNAGTRMLQNDDKVYNS